MRKEKVKQWFIDHPQSHSHYVERNEHNAWLYAEWADGDYRERVYDAESILVFEYNYLRLYNNQIDFMNIICK